MSRKQAAITDTEDLIATLNEYFKKKQVEKVLLFGSFARGTATRRSDLDLIIIKETSDRFLKRFDEFYDLYDIVPSAIDLLIYTPQEWGEIQSRRFFVTIMKEARTVYVK